MQDLEPIPLGIAIWIYYTYNNYFRMGNNLTKYLKESY